MATFIDSATGGTYTTGAGGFTTGGSAASGGGINPATGKYEGGSNNQTQSLGLESTPQMTLAQAQAEANQAFSGIVSPMSLEDIRAKEKAAQDLTLQVAGSVYDPQKQREQQVGGAQVSTAEGVVGQRQGFNVSTAELAFVSDVQTKVQDRIKAVEDTKASYIAQGNMTAADRADAQIQSLNDFNTQMTIAKANYALQVMAGNREQAQLNLATSAQALQAKQAEQTASLQAESLKLDAYKVALDTPVGKKFTVNGTEYVGLANLSGIDPANISLSTDDKGYETGIDKTTGKILWKSEVPTGKTKTQAANVTLNLNAAQSAGLNSAVTALNNSTDTNGFYNTSDVISQLQAFSIANPGKTQSFLDTVLPKVNPKDIPTITGSIPKSTPQQDALDLINAMN